MNLNATLIGELIAFTVFVLFCMKYVWPPLNGAIEARQKKIEDGLAASDKAEKDLELAREKAAEELKEAKTQAAEIIEQAKKRATLIVDEETTRGQQEREKIIAQGHSEIESERNRVKEELRQQVATLAVVGAEKILEREIDQAAHSDIVEKLVAEL
ncbi:F0F1 ATP synthase subunit B [Pseudoalteromonas rubra]|uniref:ATP synthase subunit b n=1 Tax=Pseudoalteromonas rubra TaxID=43658 RepID=A0A5S3WHX1_9GAMM|nr:F0F1 ATP synthase subunit B [Pseudoalteromonas rubra]TMP26593.1 F0F1 ATP synthase subunit B [Pseudoalteromonas rubra]TMP35781.1 F0F1 ATP synthase subunit B [Pseudoalteromonas rubra]